MSSPFWDRCRKISDLTPPRTALGEQIPHVLLRLSVPWQHICHYIFVYDAVLMPEWNLDWTALSAPPSPGLMMLDRVCSLFMSLGFSCKRFSETKGNFLISGFWVFPSAEPPVATHSNNESCGAFFMPDQNYIHSVWPLEATHSSQWTAFDLQQLCVCMMVKKWM